MNNKKHKMELKHITALQCDLIKMLSTEKGNRGDHLRVFLPCITILVSLSPDNDNNTTAEVKLSRARRKTRNTQQMRTFD